MPVILDKKVDQLMGAGQKEKYPEAFEMEYEPASGL